MAMIRGFIAASLDGYVADKDGGVDWLKPFEAVDYGYDAFIAQIGTVVMGRTTFDQIPSFGVGWPYAGKRGIVVTSRDLESPYDGVEAWRAGVEALIPRLRAQDDGDAWIVGGAALQSAFIAAGAMDQLSLFIVPVTLGDGVPLFPKHDRGANRLQLLDVAALDRGMVRLNYALG